MQGWCGRGVMVKAMDGRIVESEFEFQSLLHSDKYLLERYDPPSPPSYSLNSTTTVLPEGGL